MRSTLSMRRPCSPRSAKHTRIVDHCHKALWKAKVEVGSSAYFDHLIARHWRDCDFATPISPVRPRVGISCNMLSATLWGFHPMRLVNNSCYPASRGSTTPVKRISCANNQRQAISGEAEAQLRFPTSVFGLVPAGFHAGSTWLEPGKLRGTRCARDEPRAE
jgi:hypothetical protein